MVRHGIEWEQKGTHEEHLSVLEFKKKERAKEVKELETEKAKAEIDETKAEGNIIKCFDFNDDCIGMSGYVYEMEGIKRK